MSPTKIDKLTSQQAAQMAVYRDKWIAIGLSTEPANRSEAEDGMRKVYAAAGLAAPKIVWCGSPLSQGLTRAIILGKKLLLSASVRASVEDSVWASVWDSVWDSVRDSVWDSVGASVRDSVGDSVWASVRDSVWDSGYGQHDANWLAFYEYFREVCGLKQQTEKLVGLTQYSKNAGWFLPHRDICWVSERHNLLSRDDRGRLHSLRGPAVMYPDGWAIYAVHGVRVPSDIVEKPDSITVEAIDKEHNAEVRRVMVERMGYERYILESGAQMIHSDKYGALYRKELPGDEPLVVVHVVNSTPEPDGSLKKYMIRVPPDITTARAAVAWSFGMTAKEYAPAIES